MVKSSSTTEKKGRKPAKPRVAPATQKVVRKPVDTARAKPRAKKKEEEVPQRLRIRVRAYESKILDASVKQIIDTALRHDSQILGPLPLPTEIKKYTVNRSSFVHKDAREQFEMRTHKRL